MYCRRTGTSPPTGSEPMKKNFWKELPLAAAVIAAVLTVMFSSTNETRSALSYESEMYKAQMETSSIGVSLMENGTVAAYRDNVIVANDNRWAIGGGAILGFFGEDDHAEIGREYREELAVKNSGNIPTYVRLIIRKYWVDGTGKRVDKDPELIQLHRVNTDVWKEDTAWKNNGTHPETTVLYYTRELPVGDTTPDATDWLKIDGLAATTVKENWVRTENGGYRVTTEYSYDGLQFIVEVEADAVQTHNASDAMMSAWGLDALSEVINR